MSKIIASAAIRGASKIIERAENKYREALEKWGPDQAVCFPNTAYYLPVIYAMLGIKVEKLGDIQPVLARCRALLPPPVREIHPLPYLAPALDAAWLLSSQKKLSKSSAIWKRRISIPRAKTLREIISGWEPPTILFSENAAWSSWTAQPLVSLPYLAPHQTTRQPLKSQENYSKRIYMSSCALKTQASAFPNNWSKAGFR